MLAAALGLLIFGVYGLCEARWRKVRSGAGPSAVSGTLIGPRLPAESEMPTVTSAEPRADGVIVTPTPVSGSGQSGTGAGVISGAARPLTWTLAVTLRSEIPVRTMHLGSVETEVVDPPTVPGTLTSMGAWR
jgi:hypothetical protein